MKASILALLTTFTFCSVVYGEAEQANAAQCSSTYRLADEKSKGPCLVSHLAKYRYELNTEYIGPQWQKFCRQIYTAMEKGVLHRFHCEFLFNRAESSFTNRWGRP